MKVSIFRTLFFACLVIFLSACVSTRTAQESHNSSDRIETAQKVQSKSNVPVESLDKQVDAKAIEEAASLSAKLDWCGVDYKPFYLTFMQYQRLPNKLTPMQIAYTGAMHGGTMSSIKRNLENRECLAQDRHELSSQYYEKLKTWCEFAEQRVQLAENCQAAKKVAIE